MIKVKIFWNYNKNFQNLSKTQIKFKKNRRLESWKKMK